MAILTDHDSTNNAWKLPLTPSAAGTKTYTLETADKYVDQNIVVTETVADAVLQNVTAGAITSNASLAGNDDYFKSSGTSDYPITATSSASQSNAANQLPIKTAGWADTTDKITVSAGSNSTKQSDTKYLIPGSVNASEGAVSATAGLADTTYLTTTATGNYGPITATATATAAAGSVTVNRGWIEEASVSVDVSGGTDTKSVTKYVKAGKLQDATGNKPVASASVTSGAAYFLDSGTNSYAVTIAADAAATSKSVDVVDTAGWVPATGTITVSTPAATQATATKYIKAGAIQATGATATATANVAKLSLGTATDTKPTSGNYITVEGTATASVKTAGWVNSTANPSVTATKKTTYYPVNLTNVTTANVPPEGKVDGDYVDISATAPVLISGSYLYINGGYIGDSKISLAKLVPDGSTVGTSTSSNLIYKTVKAYNDDGKEVAGTMGDAVLGASGAVTAVSPTYNSTAGNYTVGVTGTANASTTTTGYAVKNSTSASAALTSSATLAKIALGATASGTNTVTPVITNNAVTVSGKTQITAAPSTATTNISKYYMAVNTAAKTTTATVTPKVTSAGYGDTTNYTTTATDLTVGANASGTYYIPVATGAIAASGSINNATASIGDPTYQSTGTNAGKFTLTASGSTSGTISASTTTTGYVEKDVTTGTGTLTGGSISGTKVLNKVEVQATKGTDGTVKPDLESPADTANTGNTVLTSTLTTAKPAANANKYYFTVRSTAKSGSTTVTPSVKTAGYGDTTNFTSAGNVTVTRGASASDTYYLPMNKSTHSVGAGTASNTSVGVTAKGTGKVVGSAVYYGSDTPVKTGTPTSGAYIEIGGTVANNTVSIPLTCTITEGYTMGATPSYNAQTTITAGVTKGYIPVYGGSYSIT